MQKGTLTGGTIAFLTFAVILLAAPLDKYLKKTLEVNPDWTWTLGRALPMVVFAGLILLLWQFRKDTLSSLFGPIPKDRRVEVAVVALVKMLQPFALFGAMAVWFWFSEGPVSLENRVSIWRPAYSEGEAFAIRGIVGLVLGTMFAPLIEETIFRGLMYPAWKERWGWIAAMLLTSAVFAFYHQVFVSAFIGSMVYVCLFRRCGTLLAPIAVHAVYNASNWHPLLGQFYFPDPGQPVGDISSWAFHLACLIVVAVALPAYVLMAHRDYSATDSRARAVPT